MIREATRITASYALYFHDPETGIEIFAPTTHVVEIGVESIGPLRGIDLLTKTGNGQDPGSIFGDGNVSFVTDLYCHELRNNFGESVSCRNYNKNAMY